MDTKQILDWACAVDSKTDNTSRSCGDMNDPKTRVYHLIYGGVINKDNWDEWLGTHLFESFDETTIEEIRRHVECEGF